MMGGGLASSLQGNYFSAFKNCAQKALNAKIIPGPLYLPKIGELNTAVVSQCKESEYLAYGNRNKSFIFWISLFYIGSKKLSDPYKS